MKANKVLSFLLALIMVILVSCQSHTLEPEAREVTMVVRPTVTAIPTIQPSPLPLITPNPGPREGMSMAYDSHRKVTVLFGGFSSTDKYLNDTWEYDGLSWKKIDTPTSPPSRRYASMAYDPIRQVMVLFGGGGPSEDRWLNDTWEYDGQTWQEVPTPDAPRPSDVLFPSMVYHPTYQTIILFIAWSNRYPETTWQYTGHSWEALPVEFPITNRVYATPMVYDSRRGIVVMQPSIFGATFFTLELHERKWQIVVDGQESSSFPNRSDFPEIAYDTRRDVTVLFSGSSYNNTWEFDGSRWYQADPKQSPPARGFHKLIYDEARNVVVLFGGQSATSQEYLLLGDTWEYDGVNWVQR